MAFGVARRQDTLWLFPENSPVLQNDSFATAFRSRSLVSRLFFLALFSNVL
ncbi:hypothetical protein [Scytonema sp. NUACC21]